MWELYKISYTYASQGDVFLVDVAKRGALGFLVDVYLLSLLDESLGFLADGLSF